MTTIPEALAIALEHHRAGRLQAAEAIYRQILAVEPDEPNALNLLGAAAYEAGQYETALQCLRRAVDSDAGIAVFHNNLGNVLNKLGDLDGAVASYRRALACDPRHVKSHYNLAIALQAQGRFDEAVACCRKAAEMLPGDAEALVHLGNALRAAGKLQEAIEAYREATTRRPAGVGALHNLGNALRDSGRPAEAVACYREVLRQAPSLIEALCNLGLALKDLNQLDEAIACYRRAIDLAPDDVRPRNCLGYALFLQGDLEAAEACFRYVLERDPNNATAHCNLSAVFKDQGHVDESIACCRKALDIEPRLQQAHGNLIYAMYFSPECDSRAIAAEHRRWNETFAAPLATHIAPHVNERSPEKRLRVGYVSPDFRLHPVGRFLAPLVENHDRRNFEIVAYASVRRPDEITEQYRGCVDLWRDALPLSDEQLADTIRRDQIDILVDLTMHLCHGRLFVFARKPAPVQVTYLAYCGTTGLATIDYRLTDPYLDPPGGDESVYAERSVHLPESYWCYRPAIDAPPPGPPPVLRQGRITFGSLNSFCKVSPAALDAWRRIMQATPGSRLLLHARRGQHRRRVVEFFAEGRIAEEQIEFVDFLPIIEFFQLHQRIDIALDPFPYAGGMTTCDALWMGVPVVSLVGQTAVGRGGLSILSNLGLRELATSSVEAYVNTAIDLAHDLPRLTELRGTLRNRMKGSLLMDGSRFAENVEACYRRMWRVWCGV